MSLPRSRRATGPVPSAVAAAFVAIGLSMAPAACRSSPHSVGDRLADVSWDRHVRDCSTDEGGSGLGTVIDAVVKGDVTGDQFAETFVVDRCESSTSPWPEVVEVFDGASGSSSPRRLGLLLDRDPEYPRDVAVTVEPGGRVVIVGRGLSGDAPLCCPDLALRRVYRYERGTFTLVESTAIPATSPS